MTTVARENSNSGEPLRFVVTRHREHEPTLPPAGASRLNRRFGDERPRLDAEIMVCLV
jgi:hypothetical protein